MQSGTTIRSSDHFKHSSFDEISTKTLALSHTFTCIETYENTKTMKHTDSQTYVRSAIAQGCQHDPQSACIHIQIHIAHCVACLCICTYSVAYTIERRREEGKKIFFSNSKIAQFPSDVMFFVLSPFNDANSIQLNY